MQLIIGSWKMILFISSARYIDTVQIDLPSLLMYNTVVLAHNNVKLMLVQIVGSRYVEEQYR